MDFDMDDVNIFDEVYIERYINQPELVPVIRKEHNWEQGVCTQCGLSQDPEIKKKPPKCRPRFIRVYQAKEKKL